MRELYLRRMDEIREVFARNGDGLEAVAARSALVDELISTLWAKEVTRPALERIAVVATGGYGRRQLFPYSDIDVLFCLEKAELAREAKEAIRRVTQTLWDCGLRVSPVTRPLNECERFIPGNAEFGLSLFDRRAIAGSAEVFEKLDSAIAGKLMVKDAKSVRNEMMELTRARHAKYGETLFHLEPNIKDCPGGLRDSNVCVWLAALRGASVPSVGTSEGEFAAAIRFLSAVRCFLHYRHQRDDNMLDWQAQDAAAAERIGLGPSREGSPTPDAAYWMRAYFRHGRVVERCLSWEMESAGLQFMAPRKAKVPAHEGFRVRNGRLELDAVLPSGGDPAGEPEIVLRLFAVHARFGLALTQETEMRIGDAIPMLSAHLEEGPGLWRSLSEILLGEFAGDTLRAMHAAGMLDLILPEFHGIDALVIRDAYHRYTVDEHTFVVIDTLHQLEQPAGAGAPEWRVKLGQMARELQNPALLYLAALLHDTGKGRAGGDHAQISGQMATAVMERMEMEPYDAAQVLRLIENHLEMSAALRRDIFDAETVRMFAGKVQTHEALRMLTLLTYADIQAVHPDALTPWKAENLWRLSMSAANQMDRGVDDQRVRGVDDRVARVQVLLPHKKKEVAEFLEGFPERYIATRLPEQVKRHFEMAERLGEEPIQIELQHGAVSEITVVTRDRPRLFSTLAGALAAWGMNVVTADGYADANGVVVDSLRFTDTFRTLELNVGERARFVESVRDMLAGRVAVETMLAGRRRGGRKRRRLTEVETRIDFDERASAHSTVLQVVAQDTTGLLRAISETLSGIGYNVEVALVDTEGETAIDVFYLTRDGGRLTAAEELALRDALVTAIDENAG